MLNFFPFSLFLVNAQQLLRPPKKTGELLTFCPSELPHFIPLDRPSFARPRNKRRSRKGEKKLRDCTQLSAPPLSDFPPCQDPQKSPAEATDHRRKGGAKKPLKFLLDFAPSSSHFRVFRGSVKDDEFGLRRRQFLNYRSYFYSTRSQEQKYKQKNKGICRKEKYFVR